MHEDMFSPDFRRRTAAGKSPFPDHPDFLKKKPEDFGTREEFEAHQELVAAYKKAKSKEKKLIPRARMNALKKAFGKRALPFFAFYVDLFLRHSTGIGLGPEGRKGMLSTEFRKRLNPLLKMFKDDVTMSRRLRDLATDLKPLLNKAENNPRSLAWKNISQLYSAAISDVSALGKASKTVTVKETVYKNVKDPETGEVKKVVKRDSRGRKVKRSVKDPKTGKVKKKKKTSSTYMTIGKRIGPVFISLSKASKKEVKERILRDEAPDIHAAELKLKATHEQIDEAIENFVKTSTDYTYAKEYIPQINRNVNVGQDESTRKLTLENRSGEGNRRDVGPVTLAGITIQPGETVEIPNHKIAAVKADPRYDELTSDQGRPLIPTESVTSYVYPIDGSGPYTKEEFIKEMRSKRAMEQDLARMDRLDGAVPEGKGPEFIIEQKRLDNISSGLTEDVMNALRESDQPIEYASITDDMSLQSRTTRIFPTKKLPNEYPFEGRSVIMEGRYKGLYLDDVINSEGRLLEGRHYGYTLEIDENGNKRKVKDDSVDPLAEAPHISVGEDGRLYLRVPGDNDHSDYRKKLGTSPGASKSLSVQIPPPGFQVVKPGMPGYEFTEQRNAELKNRTDKPIRLGPYTIPPGESITLGPEAMEKVSKMSKLEELTKGGRSADLVISEKDVTNGDYARGYYFDPQHFAKIREACGGSLSMSREAADLMKAHFDEMAAAERATGLTFHLQNNTDETIKLEKAGIEILPGEDNKVTVEDFHEVKALRSDPKFQELASTELEDGRRALEVSETNLRSLNASELGGFKEDIELLTKQKQALAWLEANGDAGVLALDTGLGKTITSIAHMQRLIRDGDADEQDIEILGDPSTIHTRGRFLYVAPKSLLGNMAKEARKFLTEEASAALIDRLDVMDYRAFSIAVKKGEAKLPERDVKKDSGEKTASLSKTAKKGEVKYKPWNPAGYVAIYFDEAHKEMIPKGKSSSNMPSAFEAALSFKHPRKVCLTASPVQREPMDSFLLSSICSDEVLYAPPKSGKGRYKAAPGGARKRWLREKNKFKRRFTKSIGGRVVGLTDNPVDQTALATWVKRNMFYADKMEVAKDGEYKLKEPNRVTRTVSMPEEMEKEYREATKGIKKALRAMVAKFQDYADADVDARGAVSMPIYKRDEKNKIVYHTDEDGNVQKYKKGPDGKFLTDKDGNHIEDPNGEPMPVISDFKIPGPQMGEIMEKLISKNPRSFRYLKEAMQKAILLSVRPEDYVEGLESNPKLDAALDILDQKDGSRTLFFTDDEALVVKSAIRMSKEQSQGIHVAAMKNEIRFYKNGEQLDSWEIPAPPNVWSADDEKRFEKKIAEAAKKGEEPPKNERFAKFSLPFKKKSYRAYPGFSTTRKTNKQLNNPKYQKHEWQKMVFDVIVSGDRRFITASLLGTEYAEGHNLQAFDTVIHLDRDTWSNENMKQRTARAWRQGQEKVVDVVNIDFTFDNAKDQLDRTLDEIRSYFQALESDLFDKIIKQSQETLLGSEWFEMTMKNAGQRKVDLKHAETILSPYLDAGLE